MCVGGGGGQNGKIHYNFFETFKGNVKLNVLGAPLEFYNDFYTFSLLELFVELKFS